MENVPLLLTIFHTVAVNSWCLFLIGGPTRYNALICKIQSGFKNILHLLLNLHGLFLHILISACTDSCKPYMLKFCLKTVNGQILKHKTNKIFYTIQQSQKAFLNCFIIWNRNLIKQKYINIRSIKENIMVGAVISCDTSSLPARYFN